MPGGALRLRRRAASGLPPRPHGVGRHAAFRGPRIGLAGALPLAARTALAALTLHLALAALALAALALHALALPALAFGRTLAPAFALTLLALALDALAALALALAAFALAATLALAFRRTLTPPFALALPLAPAFALADARSLAARTARALAGAPLAEAGAAPAGAAETGAGAARPRSEARTRPVAGADREGPPAVQAAQALAAQQLQLTLAAELGPGQHAADDAAHHGARRGLAGIAVLGEARSRTRQQSRYRDGRDDDALHA